ncbi:MAG: succinic semialdehyde dehydrogenase [Actinomycetales bacterium]|nr:MAG: succinic semialdehyde dehydrogenase [Actinomycetales bacterium]
MTTTASTRDGTTGGPVRRGQAAGIDPTRYTVAPHRVAQLTRRIVHGPLAETRANPAPMTGQRLASVPQSTPSDVQVAVDHARAAQRAWSRLPVARRAQVLLRMHDLVLERQVELLDLIQLETGKTRLHAFEEVADVALVCRHYGRRAARYLAPERHMGVVPGLTRAVTHHDPVGVVGVITPWNYPLTLPISDSIPALVAGNAVVLRPDSLTPLTALLGVELLCEAGLPESVLQVVTGSGSVIGQAVIDSVDYVCYTGSTGVGRGVARSAAGRLIGASMELGGKNSMYVRPDADLGRAVSGALRAAFSSGGQLCVHAERLILHEQIADGFLAEFVPMVASMRLGGALEYGYDMGSLISQSQLEQTQRHVADAVDHGATVLAGGHARPDIGPFVHEPTVLVGVTPAMACRDEETFGPVLSVYRVSSDDEAVALANDTAYGLNGSVWGRDVTAATAVARRIRCGTVNVNEHYSAAWGTTGAPMGGMSDSGLGRRHGAEGIRKYTEAQTVATQALIGLAPLPGMRDQQFTGLLSSGLTALKRIGWR